MTSVPENIKYTKDHEWVKKIDENSFLIGITDHAQDSLGDVTFVELPEVGSTFDAHEVFGVVESVKAASEVYAPVSGEVVEINGALEDDPELVNRAPTGEGWFMKIKVSDASQLDGMMDEAAYSDFVASQN